MDNSTTAHIKCPNCRSNIQIELFDYHKYQCDKSFKQQTPQQSQSQNIGSVRRNRPIIQTPTINQQHTQQPQFRQQQIIINQNNQSQESLALQDQMCRYCCESYPAFLMEEHLDVCQAKLDLRSGNIGNSNQPVRPMQNHINDDDDYDSLLPGQTRHTELFLPNGTVKIVNASRSHNGHLTTQTTITQSSNNIQMQGNQSLHNRLQIILNNRIFNIGGLNQPIGHQKKPQGLRSEELQNINTIKFKASAELSEDNRKCVICIADYHPGDDLKVLPCLHRFHIECIENWLKSSPLCPICKKDIRNQQS